MKTDFLQGLKKQVASTKNALLEERKALQAELPKLKERAKREKAVYGTENLAELIEAKETRLAFLETWLLPQIPSWEARLESWTGNRTLETQYQELTSELVALANERQKLREKMFLVQRRLQFLSALGFSVPSSHSEVTHLKSELFTRPHAWKKEFEVGEVMCRSRDCSCEPVSSEAAAKYRELQSSLQARLNLKSPLMIIRDEETLKEAVNEEVS